jgi:hypothetical protein
MVNVPVAGALATITTNRRPTEQGRSHPSLAGHHHQPGESLLCVNAHLGLLLCRDTGFCLLIGVGHCLLCMRRPLSCKGSSLLGRGRWIATKVPSSRGRKGWWPLRALGEVHAEHDASRTYADAIQRDFFTQVRASSSRSKKLTDLGQTLEECQILLCLQEVDLEVPEAILAEELERGLHPTDEQDLSVELEKACARVDRINGECAIKAEQLSRRVMRISIVLVDLGMLPIQDIP